MGKLVDWLRSTNFLVYASITLSAWGDRMWNFAVALFLIKLSPESLRLTAIYGLCCGGAVLMFAPIIGDWVDRNTRLFVARVTLICQNSFVAVSAIFILIVLNWAPVISAVGVDAPLMHFLHAAIITVAVLARLAGVGNRISVQKDWVMEICDKDKDKLAVMTATIRRIDLSNKILAPLATGQIMAFTSNIFACCFISGWNVVSMFIEYYLLWKVYHRVPALAHKVFKQKAPKPHSAEKQDELKPEATQEITDDKGEKCDEDTYEVKFNADCLQAENPYAKCETEITEEDRVKASAVETQNSKVRRVDCKRLFVGFIRLFTGWKTYMKYQEAFAGVALSCLYMTVLGFDNITMGYAFSQGVAESILGVVMALGAVIGISGTFAYPHIRRCVGIERTGLFSFTFQMLSLTLCIASIWAPGSPFDPLFYIHGRREVPTCGMNSTLVPHINASQPLQVYYITSVTACIMQPYTSLNTTDSSRTSPAICPPSRYIHSIVLLLTGISLARFGLWVSDLTISQLQLENIDATERGVVNGVQLSLNMFMDMIKFGLVVLLPHPEVFGYLVMLSVVFGLAGAGSYCCYTYRARGHLMPHCFSQNYDPNVPALVSNEGDGPPPTDETVKDESGSANV